MNLKHNNILALGVGKANNKYPDLIEAFHTPDYLSLKTGVWR
jgi:hypothetical protein